MGQPPDAHFRCSVLVANSSHASSALFRREGIHLVPIRPGAPARNLPSRVRSKACYCNLDARPCSGLLSGLCQFRSYIGQLTHDVRYLVIIYGA